MSDSLRNVLAGSVGPSDSIVVLVGLVESLTGESVALRAVVASADRALDSLSVDRDRWKAVAVQGQATIDSLTVTMTALNKARTCRVLFLECPSRTTVGLVSLAVGVVGTVLLSR